VPSPTNRSPSSRTLRLKLSSPSRMRGCSTSCDKAEQQTATSEVLKVISTTHGELEPAFEVMLEKATRLCNASFGNLLLMEGGDARVVAMHNAPSAFSELRRRTPVFRPPEWTRDPT